jgi:hypothetical protein
MLGHVVFRILTWNSETRQTQGELPAFIRLQRRVSYFGDLEGTSVV